jgi:hypothetical protein
VKNLSITDHGYPDLEGELPITRASFETLPSGEARYQRLAQMVKRHTSATFAYDNDDGALLMDVQTARLLVMVADALGKPENRAKFLDMDLGVMVDTAWKLVK